MLFFAIGTIWIIMYAALGVMLMWAGVRFLFRKTVRLARESYIDQDEAAPEISFRNANFKCFFSKLFSQPNIECFELIGIFCTLILALILFEFKVTVLFAALLCFISIALSLHFLYRMITNYAYYKDKKIRSKNAALVLKYTVKVWEADNSNEVALTVEDFRNGKKLLINMFDHIS